MHLLHFVAQGVAARCGCLAFGDCGQGTTGQRSKTSEARENRASSTGSTLPPASHPRKPSLDLIAWASSTLSKSMAIRTHQRSYIVSKLYNMFTTNPDCTKEKPRPRKGERKYGTKKTGRADF